MKGVVFNIVQEVVEQHLGPDVWDSAIEHSGVDGAFTSLGNYPDADLDGLVGALGRLAQMPRDDVLVFAGRHGFERLAERHPELLSPHATWRDVIAHLDDIIHPEVAKIYPGVEPPMFAVVDDPDIPAALRVTYTSRRQLCALAEGLIRGLGDWYRVELEVRHLCCVRQGDACCELMVVPE